MLFPTIGFLIGMIGFRTIRLIVLSLSGRPRVVPLLVFVASAFVVALAWSFVFAHVFGDTSGSLKNLALVIIFVAGLPLSGGPTGWAIARRFPRVVRMRRTEGFEHSANLPARESKFSGA